MRLTRGIAVLSVAAVAVLGLTACSSDDTGADRTSADQTSTAPEAEEAAEVSDLLTVDDFARRVAQAASEAGSYSMVMTTTVSGMTTTTTADVRYLGDTQEMQMVTEVGGLGTADVRFIDGMFYMSMGETTENKFVVIDPADTTGPFAGAFDGMVDQLDPAASVKALDGALVSVEPTGDPVELDGVQAQQYTVVVDTTRLQGALAEQAEAAGSALPAQITYQYWIGPDDLMRKMVMDMSGSTVEMVTSNWGGDVEIVAPTADQITDMTF
ncbi:MAG TPA: hypothetical protein VGC57_12575 [Cellulomonas sp.]